MNERQEIAASIALIATVPGYETTARDLSCARIVFRPRLSDRAQVSLLGTISVGPEPLAGEGDATLVSLAGTLVHEHWHTRQNPFLKTVSFWGGILTRSHPMRRYEQPAYARQAAFLRTVADVFPDLRECALSEQRAVAASFQAFYGGTLEIVE